MIREYTAEELDMIYHGQREEAKQADRAMVSQVTKDRVEKTKIKLAEARAKMQNAQSELLEAERRYNDAISAWEREWFAKVKTAK